MPIRSLHPLAAFAALAACTTVAQQQDFSKVEIKVTHVAGHIYMLEGSGGNIGVSVGDDGILIVDDEFAPLAGRIEAALKQLNPGKLRFVLNTHHHGDHTGSNAAFGAEDATIIAQSNVRTRLSADARNPAVALPVITFDQSASVHFNGEEIKLLHIGPGHTDGDSIIFFTNSNVVHMGDQYVDEGWPFIDFRSGGDLDGYIAAQQAVLARLAPEVKLIPGHGHLSTVAELKTYNAMVVESVALVRKGMAEGKSLDQLKAEGLPAKWSAFDKGWINHARWIETIYHQSHRDEPQA